MIFFLFWQPHVSDYICCSVLHIGLAIRLRVLSAKRYMIKEALTTSAWSSFLFSFFDDFWDFFLSELKGASTRIPFLSPKWVWCLLLHPHTVPWPLLRWCTTPFILIIYLKICLPYEIVSCVEIGVLSCWFIVDLTEPTLIPNRQGLMNSHFTINEWMDFFFPGNVINKQSFPGSHAHADY